VTVAPSGLLRLRRTLVAACLLAALLGCGESVGRGSDRLVLEAPKWWFQWLPVAVEARPAGLLAGREASLAVAVGSNVAGRWESKGEPMTIWIPAAFFETGANQVTIKTGSERSTAEVQIVSFGWLATLVVLLSLIAVYVVRALLRRRASAPRTG
jgi:hypothetical protein